MDDLAFWRQKLIQFFHDPPAKPFTGTPKTGKHTKVANALFDVFQDANKQRKLRHWYKSADWAAAGADRPLLYTPKQKGVSPLGTIKWPPDPQISHPLSPGCRLWIDVEAGLPVAEEAPESDEDGKDEDEKKLPRDPIGEQTAAAMKLGGLVSDWNDAAVLRNSYFALWRRFRDELVDLRRKRDGGGHLGSPLWEEMPAETRCPDHSIWDHLKVVTALAFMKPHKFQEAPGDEGAHEPWMLRFALGPTQEFIGQSRTSRDLWIGSFLLADLAWSAMEPFVEAYGPDCIVYPDLRANPRVDCWLAEHHEFALGSEKDDPRRDPSTFAAVLPTKFVALVPRGGAGALKDIEELAKEAKGKVESRWRELSDEVLRWFRCLEDGRKRPNFDAHCEGIWKRQHQRPPIYCTWTAVPWEHMGRISNPAHLRGRALPAQRADFRQPADADEAREDCKAIDERAARLAPWVPVKVWAHYEQAREVYARSNLDYHQMERGFDYAMTHHMLGVRHDLRKASDPAPAHAEEGGEKCTLCGQREALRNDDGKAHGLDGIREQARQFWANKELDPDETGAERLCAVCAVKRFLVKADQKKDSQEIGSFNRLWAGVKAEFSKFADDDGEIRVPFPSTSTIAAQKFVETVVQGGFAAEIAGIVDACESLRLPRTSFPRALPRLAAAADKATGKAAKFLKYEAQDVVFPETADGKAKALEAKGRGSDVPKMDRLKDAVQRLREKAKDLPPPGTRIAVIRMDGDNMGKLLVGDPEVIGTTWRDVLHPEVLDRLNGSKKNEHLLGAGWGDLLESKRLMGPSLHAFVSRALGHFSHRIVPWVVEREFSGRLIYCGGDDLLCIAPADEALDLAARLQQLFSAAWVVDTDPPEDLDQWGWRRKDRKGDYKPEKARKRFVVPVPKETDGQCQPIRLGEAGQPVLAHAAARDSGRLEMNVQGALLPMLGTVASLSAGIAIGHYKTPLSVLLKRSQDLLDYAKEPFKDRQAGQDGWTGRSAVAIAHASRGGQKTRFAMPWGTEGARLDAHLTLRTVTWAFAPRKNGESALADVRGSLPGRLPYKLRELGLSVRCGLEAIRDGGGSAEEKQTRRGNLLRGLFNRCLEGEVDDRIKDAAFRLWEQGISLHERPASHCCPDRESLGLRAPPEERYTDGLLLCRELASLSDSGEGEE